MHLQHRVCRCQGRPLCTQLRQHLHMQPCSWLPKLLQPRWLEPAHRPCKVQCLHRSSLPLLGRLLWGL
jgi:hypothetical protein